MLARACLHGISVPIEEKSERVLLEVSPPQACSSPRSVSDVPAGEGESRAGSEHVTPVHTPPSPSAVLSGPPAPFSLFIWAVCEDFLSTSDQNVNTLPPKRIRVLSLRNKSSRSQGLNRNLLPHSLWYQESGHSWLSTGSESPRLI